MTFSFAVCNYSFNLYGFLISGFLFYKVSVLYLYEKLLLFSYLIGNLILFKILVIQFSRF